MKTSIIPITIFWIICPYQIRCYNLFSTAIRPTNDVHHHHNNHNNHHHHHLRHLKQKPTGSGTIHIGDKKYNNLDEYKHSREFKKGDRICHIKQPSRHDIDESNRIMARWQQTNPCTNNKNKNNDNDDNDETSLPPPHCRTTSPNNNHHRSLWITNNTPTFKDTIIIPTYWHYIHTTSGQSNTTLTAINATLSTLNSAFYPDFQFLLSSPVNIHHNSSWYYSGPNSTFQHDMTRALRIPHDDSNYDACATLNIYSVDSRNVILGGSSFPADCRRGSPNQVWNDGVIVTEGTLMGGEFPGMNLGLMLVHEVGHWLGLFHTFEGGCGEGGDGDSVSDTPAEMRPAYGCEVGRDTCTNDPGVDPIHNYMDFSDDECKTEGFTLEQRTRMRSQWDEYRVHPGIPEVMTVVSPPSPSPTVEFICNEEEFGAGVNEFQLELKLDGYGSETSWRLTNMCTKMITWLDGPYEDGNFDKIVLRLCLPPAMYAFVIDDEYGDGICCKMGEGYYSVMFNGEFVAKGRGEFLEREVTTFGTCPTPTPTDSPTITPSIPTTIPSFSSVNYDDDDDHAINISFLNTPTMTPQYPSHTPSLIPTFTASINNDSQSTSTTTSPVMTIDAAGIIFLTTNAAYITVGMILLFIREALLGSLLLVIALVGVWYHYLQLVMDGGVWFTPILHHGSSSLSSEEGAMNDGGLMLSVVNATAATTTPDTNDEYNLKENNYGWAMYTDFTLTFLLITLSIAYLWSIKNPKQQPSSSRRTVHVVTNTIPLSVVIMGMSSLFSLLLSWIFWDNRMWYLIWHATWHVGSACVVGAVGKIYRTGEVDWNVRRRRRRERRGYERRERYERERSRRIRVE